MSKVIEAFLKKAGKSFKEAGKRAKTDTIDKIEDGEHVANLIQARLGVNNDNRIRAYWKYTVAEGNDEGTQCGDSEYVDGDDSLFYICKKLLKLGYDPETIKPEDLPAIFAEITEAKPLVKIRATTNGDFQNYGILEMLEGGETPEDDEDEPKSKKGKANKAEPEPNEDAEIEVGNNVTWTVGKGSKAKTLTGEVTKIKKGVATIDADDEEYKVDVEDLTLVKDNEGGDEEGDDVEVGMKCEFKKKGTTHTGKIVELLPDEDSVKVKSDVDSRTYTVEVDDIELLDDDEKDNADAEDEPEEPKKGKGKKSAEPEFEKGMRVSFKKGKKTIEGKITAIDTDDDEATVKDDDGTKHTVDLDDLTVVDDD